jgi:cyclopropane-fatty-acyl-phospholipid synthase
MLGQRLVYSCGYWRNADDLDAAQEAKLDLVCRKLGLRPGSACWTSAAAGAKP